MTIHDFLALYGLSRLVTDPCVNVLNKWGNNSLPLTDFDHAGLLQVSRPQSKSIGPQQPKTSDFWQHWLWCILRTTLNHPSSPLATSPCLQKNWRKTPPSNQFFALRPTCLIVNIGLAIRVQNSPTVEHHCFTWVLLLGGLHCVGWWLTCHGAL